MRYLNIVECSIWIYLSKNIAIDLYDVNSCVFSRAFNMLIFSLMQRWITRWVVALPCLFIFYYQNPVYTGSLVIVTTW